MPRAYCELSDVQRLLRAQGPRESRVRFSNSYKDLKSNSSNTGNKQLSGVTFLSSYSGNETFTFSFTDSTSFSVVGDVGGSVGSGVSNSTFTAANKFTIPSSNWTGLASSGDEVYITSNSDMSDDDGDDFILDSSRFINSKLKKSFGDLPNFTEEISSEDIPDSVVYAAMRYAAYEIFHSIFAGSSIDEESPVQKWKEMADEALNDYVETGGDGPRWRARESLIVEIGVEGVGEGTLDIETVSTSKNHDFKR